MGTPVKDLADGTILVRDSQYIIFFSSVNRYIAFDRRLGRFKSIKMPPNNSFIDELRLLPFTIYDIFKILLSLEVSDIPRVLTNMTSADIGEIQLEATAFGSTVRIKISAGKWIQYDDSGFAEVMKIDPDPGNYPRIVFKNLPKILEILANHYEEAQ